MQSVDKIADCQPGGLSFNSQSGQGLNNVQILFTTPSTRWTGILICWCSLSTFMGSHKSAVLKGRLYRYKINK